LKPGKSSEKSNYPNHYGINNSMGETTMQTTTFPFHPISSLRHSSRGQSFVEVGVFLVVLMILLAGVLDLGRAFFTFIALRDAAQEGALYGSTNPGTLSSIIDRVRNTSNTPVDLTNTSDVQVTVTFTGPPCLGNAIRVDVEYVNFPLAMPFLGTILGSQTIPIHATVTDTILRPACP
jgi:Flp pilus assembly protein TadG